MNVSDALDYNTVFINSPLVYFRAALFSRADTSLPAAKVTFFFHLLLQQPIADTLVHLLYLHRDCVLLFFLSSTERVTKGLTKGPKKRKGEVRHTFVISTTRVVDKRDRILARVYAPSPPHPPLVINYTLC